MGIVSGQVFSKLAGYGGALGMSVVDSQPPAGEAVQVTFAKSGGSASNILRGSQTTSRSGTSAWGMQRGFASCAWERPAGNGHAGNITMGIRPDLPWRKKALRNLEHGNFCSSARVGLSASPQPAYTRAPIAAQSLNSKGGPAAR
ncbi:hypothetical protein UVI_02021940 [Ustilaginoidea virens]|uniref:Uncharacterized protein n=1 Tax=Ustilaginoidea virens TaxID=1159556 RepID=A0A1B5L0V3_USTVR|nr:hypothetical protein UVI_02021940 [Ustilaginoidea virens]